MSFPEYVWNICHGDESSDKANCITQYLSNPVYLKKDPFIINQMKLALVNTPLYWTALILVLMINYKTDNNIYLSIFTFYFITSWSYFAHLLCHQSWFKAFGQIHLLHHDETQQHSPIAFIIESLLNFFMIGGFIVLLLSMRFEKVFGFKIFNNYIILFWALFYTSYHLINYHMIKPDAHKQHHISNGVNNYGPEWMDIIFDTKSDGSEFEDLNSGIINMSIITLVILGLKNTDYDLAK